MRKLFAAALATALAFAAPALAQVNANTAVKSSGSITANDCAKFLNSGVIVSTGAPCVTSASEAPSDATFITQTPNLTLTAEQPLSALATGLVKNTTSTGVLSIVVPAAGIETWLATPSSANLLAAITDETGTGSAVFSASPTFTGTLNAAAITATGTVAAGATNSIRWTGRAAFASTSASSISAFQSDLTTPASFVAAALSTTSAGAVSTNPTFAVRRSSTAFTFSDNAVTKIDWNTEDVDVGGLFDSTTNDEWCPAWTGVVELTVNIQEVTGTYLAGNLTQVAFQKGTTGAEATFRSGMRTLASTTSAGGLSFTLFDSATSTDCYTATIYSDTTGGSASLGTGSTFGGRAF